MPRPPSTASPPPSSARSLWKARYLPAEPPPTSSSDEEVEPGVTVADVRRARNPLDPLRRGSVLLQFVGAGAVSLGSTLVISLYVTGPPRLNDMATSSTAVLFLTLLFGCMACIPSWIAALVVIFGKKAKPEEPPPHGRLLRLAALASLFMASLYSIATVVLYSLLWSREAFVSFCLQNLKSTTEENCEERWNRDWVIILVVGIVWIFHIALGFPVYRYTRGTEYGRQLESGFLLELGDTSGRTRPPQRRLSAAFDSRSASEDEDEPVSTRKARRNSLAERDDAELRMPRRSRRGRQLDLDEGSSGEELVGSGGEGVDEEEGGRKSPVRRSRTRRQM